MAAQVDNLLPKQQPRYGQAANEGAPESSPAVNAICLLIREQKLWPEDVIAILNATSNTLVGSNGHLKLHEQIVEELDHLSDWIGDEVKQ